MPLVSIGMPVYNGERFLEEAVDSILAQTFSDFELVISDNASTDGTKEICEYYERTSSRVHYSRNVKNLGAHWNYNHVFRLSNGQFFKWASHDDVCAPMFLEKCIEVLEHNPFVVLCYPNTVIIDEHSNHVEVYPDNLNLYSPKPSQRFKDFMTRGGGECNAVFGLIRTSCLKKTSLIGNYPSSDSVLLAHLSLLGPFSEIPDKLFFRRDYPGTSVRSYLTPSQRAMWFDPSTRGHIVLSTWRLLYEYVKILFQTRIQAFERFDCLIQMAKWMKWARRDLRHELQGGATDLIERYRTRMN